MANWKFNNSAGLHLVEPRPQLGFVAVSPSPDPVSLAFDAAMLALSLVKRFSGSEEADALVQHYQNPLQNALAKISNQFVVAGDSTPAAQFYDWAAKVKAMGDKFITITQNFPNKGPGALRTIMGVNQGGVWVQAPPAAPGYLTGLLNNILNRAQEAEVRQGQVGFNWDKLFDFGRDVVGDVWGGDGGNDWEEVPPGYPGPSYPGPRPYPSTAAGISPTTLLVGGVLLLLVAPKLMKAFR
jgi:hypothetical protein